MNQLPVQAIPIAAIDDEGYGLVRFRRDLGTLRPLRESLKLNSLASPPTVWKVQSKGSDRFVVIDGNRRVAAIKELEKEWEADQGAFPLAEVQCVVFEGRLQDAQQLSVQLHFGGGARHDLNPADCAVAVRALLDIGYDQVEAAAMLCVTQGWISQLNKLAIRLIPAAMEALRASKISKHPQADSLAKLVRRGKPDVARQEAKLAEYLAQKADPPSDPMGDAGE